MDTSDIFRIAFRLNRLFFPADLHDFAQVILKKQYVLLGPLGPRRPLLVGQLGGAMDPMAQKGDTLLDVNTERGVVGSTGPNIQAVTFAMREIVDMFQEEFFLQKKDYMFFELTSSMIRVAKGNPISTMAGLSNGVKHVKRVADILGTDLAMRSIRLSSKNKSPQDPEYFDITIEPYTSLPTKKFFISIIYRQNDLDTLTKKIMNLQQQVDQIIESIQRQDQTKG